MSTGNLNLLYPQTIADDNFVEAQRPVRICDIEIVPPQGQERLFAVWSEKALDAKLLSSIAEEDVPDQTTRAYRATRDIRKIAGAICAEEYVEVVDLVLDHRQRSPKDPS